MRRIIVSLWLALALATPAVAQTANQFWGVAADGSQVLFRSVPVGVVTGLGTGVATALGVNVGTAGAFVANGGALGSPSSAGTMPAFTFGGTVAGNGQQLNNIIIGTTTPRDGSFAALTATSLALGGCTIGANVLCTTGATALSGGLTASSGASALTASTPFTFNQTWNGVAVAFTGVQVNITDMASTAASKIVLFATGAGATEVWSVTKGGIVTYTGASGAAAKSRFSLSGELNPRSLIGLDASDAGVIQFGDGTAAVDTTISRTSAGIVRIGTTTTNASGTLQTAGLTTTGTVTMTLATDNTHTTRTVCQDTTSSILFFGSGASGVCLGTSSARYKHDIADLAVDCGKLADLKPKRFRYNQGYGDDGAREQYGFIAEDVVKILPELVGLDDIGRPNTVDMMALIPIFAQCQLKMSAR